MENHRIIVTGGAGFIGSAVARHIIKDTPDSLCVVDKLTYAGNLENLAEISADPRFRFEKADICDRAAMDRIFAEFKPTHVMHLAAESHVDRSIDGPGEFIQTNIVGTYTLLESARKYFSALGDEAKRAFRFHHISTDEVYGDLNGPEDFFRETTPYAPSSPYSASKASSDHLVRAWKRTFGLPTIVTNCSNNYGPYHFPEKLIPLIINNILEGKKLPVYGKGDNVRDWLYVEDHCKAIDLVVRQGREGEVYNVGGHNEMTNINIVKLTIKTIHDMMAADKNLRNILKKQVKDANGDIDISWINDELITFVADRLGHDQRYAIDPTKIKEELGWYPETMFADGIVKTIKWNLEHQDWIAEVTSGDYQKYYEQMYGNR